jgi:putative ABC transport system permease protein
MSGQAFSRDLPTSGQSVRIEMENDPASSARAAHRDVVRADVDRHFFRAFGVTMLAGRGFEPRDHGAGAEDVVVVNRAFAAQRLPEDSPVGRRVRYPPSNSLAPADPGSQRWYDVIGVVENIDTNPFHENLTEPRVYHPLKDTDTARAYLSVRMPEIPQGAAERLRNVAARVDPSLVVEEVITLSEVHRVYRIGTLTAAIAVVVGLSAVLLLSAAGIYALMSFTVTERRREIAIRTTLGAQPGQLLGSIFRRALRQIAIGVAFGVAIALLLDFIEDGEALQGYRAVLLMGMIAVMSLVGTLAAVGPARRGLRIEPLEALKAE